ncbi:hypothetical protein HZA56_05675 [Candidatus Poribacteria bacterium]|nr:hypothetical protein [Candidatus Poribacteria bacterium]
MKLDKKVVAAVNAAVVAYIEAEKVAVQAARPARFAGPATDSWSQSGRQEIMRHRQMWQLRIVSR